MEVQIFTKIDREHDQRRWYAVAWGATLFGRWVVARSWGRLGSDWAGRCVDEFDTAEEAAAEAGVQIERRERRGYRAVEW